MRFTSKHVWVLAGALIAITALSATLMLQLTIAGPRTIMQNDCGNTTAYTISAHTAFATRSAQKETTIALSVQKGSAADVTFYTDSSCSTPTTTLDIAKGTTSATFYTKTNTTVDYIIVVSAKSALSGTMQVHVTPAPAITQTSPVTATKTIGVLVNGSFTNSQKITVAQSLNVSYLRTQFLTEGNSNPTDATALSADVTAGFKIIPSLRNMMPFAKYSDPVKDISVYKSTVSAFLNTYHPEVVAVENEEDNKAFIPNTSVDQYIAELQAVIDVAHPLGVKVTNGGISFPDVALATWNYLWTSGQQTQADAYSQTLSGLTSTFASVLNDLPTQANPSKPILAHNVVAKAALDRTNQLLTTYKTMNLDYINFHWYSGTNGTMQQSVAFLTKYTGKPALTNELGQWDQSPQTVTALLNDAATSHLAYTIWYSGDGDRAIALQNPDTSLRPNGVAFQNAIKTMSH